MENSFPKMFVKNIWGTPESVSGSHLMHTRVIREELPNLVSQIFAKTLLDIPCGNFNWLKDVHLDLDLYIGADSSERFVENNQLNFGHSKRCFLTLDLTKNQLPTVDLVLCRDYLVHLSLFEILLALNNIKASGSKYLLTTTFTQIETNVDLIREGWRPLNFQKAPFCFPEPLKIIYEDGSTPGCYDKSLGLWRIDDLDPNLIYVNLLLEALADCDRVLALNANNLRVLNNKATTLIQLGDWYLYQAQYPQALQCYYQAISHCTQALVLNPAEVEAHYHQGNSFQKIGNFQANQGYYLEAIHSYQEAIACYSKALLYKTDLVEVLYNQGQTLIHLGNVQSRLFQQQEALKNWQLALLSLNRALAITPQQESFQNLRDRLQEFLGEVNP